MINPNSSIIKIDKIYFVRKIFNYKINKKFDIKMNCVIINLQLFCKFIFHKLIYNLFCKLKSLK